MKNYKKWEKISNKKYDRVRTGTCLEKAGICYLKQKCIVGIYGDRFDILKRIGKSTLA